MKKIFTLIIALTLLITGCGSISSNENNKSNMNKEIQVDEVPSQFHSETEFVEGVKTLKQDKENKSEKVIGGKTGNRDELDKRDYYYMPVTIPNGYEFNSIIVVPDNLRSTYKKNAFETDTHKMFSFGYYTSEDRTMEKIIKVNKLIQSKFSDKLYFFPFSQQSGYSLAYYELDDLPFYIKVPYEISIDNENLKNGDRTSQLSYHDLIPVG